MIRRLITTAALLLLVAALLAPGTAEASTTAGPTGLSLARATRGAVLNGHVIAFKGTAPARLNGRTVLLMRRVGLRGRAITVGTARVSHGRFAVSGRARGMGSEYWRVTATASRVVQRSRWVRTSVYSWLYLADETPADDNCWDSYSSYKMGGVNYLHTVGGGSCNTLSASYNLGYHCITLDAWIGIGDDSTTGTSYDFSAALDGASTDYGNKGIGHATHITLATSGTMRLGLQMTETDDIGEGDAFWGSARILCNAQP